MNIFKNVMKAFSDELSYNKEYYTKKEQEKLEELYTRIDYVLGLDYM